MQPEYIRFFAGVAEVFIILIFRWVFLLVNNWVFILPVRLFF